MDSVPPPTFLQRVQAKLAASRFFTFSLMLHFIIVMLGGSVVIIEQIGESPDFEPDGNGGPLVAAGADDVPAPPAVAVQMQTALAPSVPTAVQPQVEMITVVTPSPTTFQVAMALPQANTAPAVDATKTMGKISSASTGTGLGQLPASMMGRAGGTQRRMAMQRMGGKAQSELAVLKGLHWLKLKQNPDGSWSDQFRPSMTGLALLCYLGHGETQLSREFGATVNKAVNYILEKGTQSEGRLSMQKTFTQTGVYEHGIVTYALGEYYSMTKDERVKELLGLAVGHIVRGQAGDGGWQYAYSKDGDSDTSVSGWQIQALKAAHLTGLNLPGVDAALGQAMLNLERVQGPKGGFGYRTKGDGYSLAGVGVLCTYFWRGEKDPMVRNGVKFIIEKSEKDNPVKYQHEKADLYAWYYHTQACLMYGGSAWSKWNRWFQDQLIVSQTPEGFWPPTGNPKGHGPMTKPELVGQIYRTTLCVLMLEVFYRYMPTTKT